MKNLKTYIFCLVIGKVSAISESFASLARIKKMNRLSRHSDPTRLNNQPPFSSF